MKRIYLYTWITYVIVVLDSVASLDKIFQDSARKAQCISRCLKQHGESRGKKRDELRNGIYRSKDCRSNDCKNCKQSCHRNKDEEDPCPLPCRYQLTRCLCQNNEHNTNGSEPSSAFSMEKPRVICKHKEKANRNNHTTTLYVLWPFRTKHPERLPDNLVFISASDVTTSNKDNATWGDFKLEYSNLVEFSNLRANTRSRFLLIVVSDKGMLEESRHTEWITALKDDYKTPRIRNLTVKRQRLYKGHVSARISWDAEQGPPCFYKYYAMASCKTDDYKEEDLQFLQQNSYWINDLHFRCNYSVKLEPYGGPYLMYGGNYTQVHFMTLDCLNATEYNYTVCAPENVTNITYQIDDLYTKNSSKFGDITIGWNPPKHAHVGNEIQEYRVKWQKDVPYDNYHHLKFLEPHKGDDTIPGNKSWLTIEGIHWFNTYHLEIVALSEGGVGAPAVQMISFGDVNFHPDSKFKGKSVSPAPSERDEQRKTYLISIVTSICIIILAFILVFCLRWRKEKRQRNIRTFRERSVREEEFNPIYRCSQNSSACCQPLLDEHEVDFLKLELQETIGEGAFGKVLKAEYTTPTNQQITVAVKMLKDFADRNEQRNLMSEIEAMKELDFADRNEQRNLMSEIEAMKQLGNHPNIVSMIGYCTRGPELCLLMDYCPLGDLRKYLLSCRHKTVLIAGRTQKPSSDSGISRNSQACEDTAVPSYTENSGLTQVGSIYSSENSTDTRLSTASSEGDDVFLLETTLLSYARQIAMGMEYLSSKNFIHRDLATRNILMYDYKRLKISDFGLTRYVYETNMYQPTSARKLPYKWMAIESIFDQIFTIKSDIWSFGIVLWEIVTLGGSPYPGIPNEDLFNLLMDGYRMEKPENCSQELYKMMLDTWHPQPSCRPTFTDLRQKLESMLELTKSYINLSVSVSQDYYENDTSSIPEDSADSMTHREEVTVVDPQSSIEFTSPIDASVNTENNKRQNFNVEVDNHADGEQPYLSQCSVDTTCKLCTSPLSRGRGNYSFLPVPGTSDDTGLSSAMVTKCSYRLDQDDIVNQVDSTNYTERNPS